MKLLIILFFVFLSCCSYQTITEKAVLQTTDGMQRAFKRLNNFEHAKQAGPALLVQLDGLVLNFPDNEKILLQAAEMNCSYPIAFIEPNDLDKNKEWAIYLYNKALDYSLDILFKVKGFKEAYNNKNIEKFRLFLKNIDKKYARALFWAGNSIAMMASIDMENFDNINKLEKAKAIMDCIIKLDERTHFAGAHLFWAIYYATNTELSGEGSISKSKYHFDKVFKLTNNKYLPAYYYFAGKYCVQAQNKKLFESTIEKILHKAGKKYDPDLNLINKIAAHKTKELKSKQMELFLE